ncbi:hypothetical protein AAFC00_003757 [Neodothiora populina]|uniref:Copper transport protein n=1 Tax=Neodothiora populina TaxID=2781224 RepID=A0ABR3PFB7_9PEZI
MDHMDMSSMDMSSPSTTSSAMSMSTGSSMSGMSSMGSMSMVFTTDHSTPLYSTAWTPTSTGAYAGTCIFLIVLAIIARCLQAWRVTLEMRWHDRAVNRRYVVVAPPEGEAPFSDERLANPEKSDEAVLTVRGLDERVRIVKHSARRNERKAFRLTVDLPRACIYTVQAGVGYLLMLAVMTLNVGYFLSVLAGLFVGELLLGRYTHIEDDHH